MRKILLLLLIPAASFAQYELKVVSISNSTRDSLYAKTNSPDTLWRKSGNIYNTAYVAKQWAYFPFFQPIDQPTTLAGYGITNGLTIADAAATYQPIGNYASGVSNTGDNASNTTYANDYRAANFIAGTNYLAPNGNGSALTGLTKTQVGLANVDNVSDANKPVSTATQIALDAKQVNLISGTNIKTVNGNNLLGSGNISISGAPTFITLPNNFSSTSTTPAAVTGWSFAVTSGITYRIQVIGAYQTAATTTGGIIGISLTGATGTVRGSARGAVVSTAAATELVIGIVSTSGAGSTLTTTGVTAINSPHAISMDIVFTCTGTGTLNIVWGTEVNASAAQINQNSALIYQALN